MRQAVRLWELDTLRRLTRARRAPDTGQGPDRAPDQGPPQRLAVPDGMVQPLGCDAVAVPEEFGPQLMERLPRVGCVYGDGARWWWIVPADSDVALEWPAPARYAPGAVVPREARRPSLIHRPDGDVPYTPPIPLYVALCRLTGAVPGWSASGVLRLGGA